MLIGLIISAIVLIYFNRVSIYASVKNNPAYENLRAALAKIGILDALLFLAGAKFAHIAYSVPSEYFEEIPHRLRINEYALERTTYFSALILSIVCFAISYFIYSKRAKII